MKISETFYSIQGEGKYMGVPSFFIRTSYCNLRCQWLRPDGSISRCDTPYTSWNPEFEETSLDDLIAQTKKFAASQVVITGGEPFLQREELQELCRRLKQLDKFITLETNATIYADLEADFISMSPKLSSSTPRGTAFERNHERHRLNPEAIAKFMNNHDYQLKYVVSCSDDLAEILEINRQLSIPREKVYLMPESKTLAELNQSAPAVVELAKEYGFNYSDRLHIRLWDNR